jgi:hypothetical protein
MRPISKRIAVLCLMLMLWSAIAFAVHHHSDGDESARCSVCIAALSSAPTVPALPTPAIFLAVAAVRTEPVAAAKQRLIAFALTVRPPPEL